MPEIAEAQALLAALHDTDEVKADVAQRRRMTQLQAAYGAALISARGYGARETSEAFARARRFAAGDADAPERLVADYGLWAGSYVRGELPLMRTHAAAFMRDVEARPDSSEAGIAHRVQGMTHYFAGEFVEAVRELERALALFEPGRDDDLAVRFPPDPGVASMIYLAFAWWALGEAGRAASFLDRKRSRIAELSHAPMLALGAALAAFFALMRGDRPRARTSVSELARIVRDHDLPLFRGFGEFLVGWATFDGGALADGLEAMRRGAESLRRQNAVVFDGLVKIALSEAEARGGDAIRALATLGEALATCERSGHSTYEAELYRARGELLFEQNPAEAAPAEEALQAAIAVAHRQGALSFHLRAAFSLSKLYQSTGRPVDAHAVLAPALEGFAPTPEMPEIAEAQALLAALAETDEVKAAAVQRQRRLHLQTAYGQAVMWSKGFAAEETKAAFARATDLAANAGDFAQRFAAAHGQWTLALLRGELRSATGLASACLRDAENAGCVVEVGVAHRGLGLISYYCGDFARARSHCERAIDACGSVRDQETRERYSNDTGCVALGCLAVASWQLGNVERARALIDAASRRGSELSHVPSMAHPLHWRTQLELLRGDAAAALSSAETLEALSREHGMTFWSVTAELHSSWARGRLYDPVASVGELRRALKAFADQGAKLQREFFEALLAQLEAEALGATSGLARIDEALSFAHQSESRCDLAFLHRVRGHILLRRDPTETTLAEEAYRAAIAIAKEQGARSHELLASLSLAKLYRSTACHADGFGSGSYFPPPVKAVPIPKKSGGVRVLGVPTVSDRIAQTAVKMWLEPRLDPIFHRDSYGYRPGKSALEAIAVTRRRCWDQDWVVEFDIRGLFDNLDHSLLMTALRKHCQEPWILLAHAVLAPALEGFSPTPEMPEIAEAQALLAALA